MFKIFKDIIELKKYANHQSGVNASLLRASKLQNEAIALLVEKVKFLDKNTQKVIQLERGPAESDESYAARLTEEERQG